MFMGHHINMHGQHAMLKAHNIKKGAQDIMKNSLYMKKSAQ